MELSNGTTINVAHVLSIPRSKKNDVIYVTMSNGAKLLVTYEEAQTITNILKYGK